MDVYTEEQRKECMKYSDAVTAHLWEVLGISPQKMNALRNVDGNAATHDEVNFAQRCPNFVKRECTKKKKRSCMNAHNCALLPPSGRKKY